MRHFATLAFIAGIFAVSLASFRNNFVRPPTHEEAAKKLAAVAAEATTKIIEEKILRRESSGPPVPAGDWKHLPLHPYQIAYTVVGLVAIALGSLSWAKRNRIRLSGAAVALGIVAVAWEWALTGVMIAVVIIICANLG